MIVCGQCGFRNVDTDAFCGSCGGFLEWTGEAVAPPAVEETVGAAAPPKRSLMNRIQTVLSLDVYAPGEEQRLAGDGATATGPGGPPSAGPRPPGPPGPSGPP